MEMECSDSTAATLSSSPSSSSSPPPPPTPNVVLSPCAACKILRRRCDDTCVLAPYFPPTDPAKFTTAHRVFGASNIIKFLQEIPEFQRGAAVDSMIYEAQIRIQDPINGCAGVICQLQKQINELQAQLAKIQVEVLNMQCPQTNLLNLRRMEMLESPQPQSYQSNFYSFDYNDEATWEPLWT